jgi:hypothetical protein
MAGEAKTNAFMLATATVMLGTPAQLWDLNPAAHSIGLVKNFQITATPKYTDLTQGIRNNVVYSVMTDNPVVATMEVFEYTAKNLTYGLGLDGSTMTPIATTDVLKTTITGDGTTTNTAVITTAVDLSANYPVGSYVFIQELGGTDLVWASKITASVYVAGLTQTLTFAHYVPAGVVLPAGSLISKSNRINVGAKAVQPFFSAKIVGLLPEGNEPCVLLIPKLRVIKGFTLAFNSQAFGNLPFEFQPHELVSTDANYAEFTGTGPVAILARQ